MPRAGKRRTRRSASGVEQINGECGEVPVPVTTPVANKNLQVSSKDELRKPDNHSELLGHKELADTAKICEQNIACVPLKTLEAESHIENIETPVQDRNEDQSGKDTSSHHICKDLDDEMKEVGNGLSNGFSGEDQKQTPETGKKSSCTKFSGSHRELVMGLPCDGQFQVHKSRMSATSSKKLGGGGERKVLFSSHKRVVKSKEAASSVDANPTPVDGPKKEKRGRKIGKTGEDDEYTRIKKKLRYLLNRINYEQSLINAYSSEGWKGLSLEKLRPERELERATKEILRRKVKIRDLFQHLDTLCAEGSLPVSLFDSDGEISSEDIFCAKCGSEDLSADNDIILCDGFCDRGFHQYCIQPPLRKEDIPPDDEGWLCPGCECKDDSLELLNDSLGTKFLISHTWEKIFPEAAAAMAGGDQNLNVDLPSDDSDDDEYDPDGLDNNEIDGNQSDGSEESENEDGSSDESDFTSASDEMVGTSKQGQDLDSSDDSEDDDYDPDAPTLDEDKIQESSSSDFTSDSEDLETSLKSDEPNQQNEATQLRDPGEKEPQLRDDATSEPDTGIHGPEDVPCRRKVERLDYKKLYDEEYENVPSSSSEDEDWDKIAGETDSMSADEEDTVPLQQSSKAEKQTSARKRGQKLKSADKKDTVKASQQVADENGSPSGSSAYKQTDAKTQKLFKSFQENRYPDKSTKENLAKELKMTVTQVTNWFKNRRSSTSKPLVKLVSMEDVEKSITGKEGGNETSVAGSSKRPVENESVAANNSKAPESADTGSRKRRRR